MNITFTVLIFLIIPLGILFQNYLNLFHVQTVLQAGLLKEGMCAVQDESAGKL